MLQGTLVFYFNLGCFEIYMYCNGGPLTAGCFVGYRARL